VKKITKTNEMCCYDHFTLSQSSEIGEYKTGVVRGIDDDDDGGGVADVY